MGVRRQQGEGSIYQRASDGRWVGVVDLGWVGGKRVRKSVTAATLRELRPKIARLKSSIESGVVPDDVTVGAWLTHWLDEIAPAETRPRTLSEYRGYQRRYLDPAVGKVRLDRLKPEHVRALLRGMDEQGLSTTTQRQAYAVLRHSLEVAVKEQRVTRNVAALVKAPKAAKNPHGSLSREEAHAMLDLLAAYGDDGEWATSSRFLAAIFAGMRQGEALGLRWEDIDLSAPALHIVRSVQRLPGQGLVVQDVKSAGSVRRVPLMPPLQLALGQWQQDAPRGFVWGGSKPTDPRADWGRWKGLLWAAGCADHPLHAARATTANILHEARVPDRVIAAILGHANFEVTWTHYLSAEDRQIEAAMRDGWTTFLAGA